MAMPQVNVDGEKYVQFDDGQMLTSKKFGQICGGVRRRALEEAGDIRRIDVRYQGEKHVLELGNKQDVKKMFNQFDRSLTEKDRRIAELTAQNLRLEEELRRLKTDLKGRASQVIKQQSEDLAKLRAELIAFEDANHRLRQVRNKGVRGSTARLSSSGKPIFAVPALSRPVVQAEVAPAVEEVEVLAPGEARQRKVEQIVRRLNAHLGVNKVVLHWLDTATLRVKAKLLNDCAIRTLSERKWTTSSFAYIEPHLRHALAPKVSA